VTNENTPFENNLLRHFTFILDGELTYGKKGAL
jgi:hypothetical protein